MREQRFATGRPVRLQCSVTAGTITVDTTDDAEASVALDGPHELVDAMRVELVGDRLIVSEPRSSFRELLTGSDRNLDLTVRLPHKSGVAVRSASSDATLDGTFGDIELQSASGELRVGGAVEGDVSVKSASGDVQLPRVRGELDLQTVSGDLRAASIGGPVTVRAVSGEVRIEALRAGTVSVRSVSGDVVLGIEPGSAVDIDATSASGRLVSEVALAESPDGDDGPTVVIRASTASGDIRVLRAAQVALG